MMPRKPDLPCSSCGNLMWRGTGSLPEGEATCQPCRRGAPPPDTRGRDLTRPCAQCGKPMWRNRNALPPGEATCRPCRLKASGGPKAKPAPFTPELRTCVECGDMYEAHRWNMKYCGPGCRCRVLSRRVRFGAVERPSAAERGYGSEHQRERRKWKPLVESGNATCCLCGYAIEAGTAWHLDHTPDRTSYRGVAHAECNIRDGAKRGRSRQTHGWVGDPTDKTCATCGSPFTTVYARQTYCSHDCRPSQRGAGPSRKS